MTLVLKDSQTTDDGLKRVGVGSVTALATRIVPGSSYALARIEVKIQQENGPVGNAHLALYADDGSGQPGTLIGTSVTSIDASTLPNPADWVGFDFSGEAMVVGVPVHPALYGDGVAPGFGGGNLVWRLASGITGENVTTFEDGAWGIPSGGTDAQGDFKTYADDSGGGIIEEADASGLLLMRSIVVDPIVSIWMRDRTRTAA